jgi:hypothetical protein
MVGDPPRQTKYGIANVKWLKRIEVRDRPFRNQFMARDYVGNQLNIPAHRKLKFLMSGILRTTDIK